MAQLSPDALRELAIVLAVALVGVLLASRLRQPPVVGYLIGGALGAPVLHAFVTDLSTVNFLADLGIILLMFTIGLEFNFRKFREVGFVALFAGGAKIALLLLTVNGIGFFLGFAPLESLYLGAALSVSSTLIVVRLMDKAVILAPRLRSTVLGILIVEDLAAVLLLTVLGSASTLGGVEFGGVLGILWNMLLFFAAVMVVGLYFYPRFMDWVWARHYNEELLLLAAVGFSFGLAVLAGRAGYSVALGAFLAGAIVSESHAREEVQRLVKPMRNFFAILFFVSVGLLFEPGPAIPHIGQLLLMVALFIPLRLFLTAGSAYFTGQGGTSSLLVAASLLPVGEFSFVLLQQGVSLGSVQPFLFTTVVAVALVEAAVTPYLVRTSPALGERINRSLPAGLRGFLAAVASWVTLAGRAALLQRKTARVVFRKSLDIGANIVFMTVIWLIASTAGNYLDRFGVVHRWTGGFLDARALSFLVGAVLVLPSAFIILRRVRELLDLSFEFLARVSPAFQGPYVRRGLVNGLFLLLALLLLTAALPVLSRQVGRYGFELAALFLLLVAVAGLLFWRSVSDIQARMENTLKDALLLATPKQAPRVRSVERVLEGFLENRTIDLLEVPPDSPAAGRTMGQLNLRAQTGVTVISIDRAGELLSNPSLSEVLRAGDLLVVLGTAEERAKAQDLLGGKGPGISS